MLGLLQLSLRKLATQIIVSGLLREERRSDKLALELKYANAKIQAQDQQLQRQEPKGSEGLKLQLEVANAELKILRLQVQLSAALNLEAAKHAESSSDRDLAYNGLETRLGDSFNGLPTS